MLHITLGPTRKPADGDPLGRSVVGFHESMSQADLYEANRGCWVLGERADKERYALLSFQGTVRQAIKIDQISDHLPTRPTRRAIEGRVLQPGDPVYDKYVGKPSPVVGVRNPVTYFTETMQTCACGCGSEMPSRVSPTGRVILGDSEFLPGHNLQAILERVSRVGTVRQFLQWFDATYEPTNQEGSPAVHLSDRMVTAASDIL